MPSDVSPFRAQRFFFRRACLALLAILYPVFVLSPQAQTTISGRITNERTGFGIINIDLDVFDDRGNSVTITGGRSGTDGLYSLTLPGPGRYIVRADPSAADFFIDQYYNKVFLPSQATLLDLAADNVRAGIDFSLTTGFLISGSVTSSGAPIANIDLDLYSATGEFLSGYPGTSSSAGTFTIGALPPGQYYLRATPSVALSQYYVATYVGGAYQRSSASPLTITSADITNVSIDLIPGGTISGRIFDRNTQAGIAGVDLDVFDALGNLLPYSARSDISGTYVLGPIPAGSYKIKADPATNYAALYFPATQFRADAQLVNVQVGQETQQIDLALERAGAISGRILDAETGLPIPGVDLDVYDSSGRLLEATTLSDGMGFYQLQPIAVGSVYVRAQPGLKSGHVSRFYDGAETIATAAPVQIVSGQGTTVDFRLNPAGWIEGKVTNGQGSPLPAIDLDLYLLPSGDRSSHTAKTKSDGTFVLGPLSPGNYTLRCDPDPLQGYARTYYPTSYFHSSAQSISVNAGQGTTTDFVLNGAGSISGRIVDVGNATGIAGIDLDVFDGAGTELDVTANSDSTGNFILGPIPAGTFYVRADPGVFDMRMPQYFAGASNILTATAIAITSGVTTTNINFALSPAGWISGVVKNGAGAAVAGIDLDIYAADSGERILIGALTDTNGAYHLGPLGPGSYLVRCDPDITQGYAIEYYAGKPLKALADPVTVQAFAGVTNVDFTLDPAGSISGRVIAADSDQPLSGVLINVFQAGSLGRMDRFVRTDSQGVFNIGPFPLGSYIVGATPDALPNYTRTFFASTSDINTAEIITLSGPEVRGNVEVRVLKATIGNVTLLIAQSGAGNLTLSAAIPTNQIADLQTLSTFSGGTWIPVGTPGQNDSGVIKWTLPITLSNQFYRVRLP